MKASLLPHIAGSRSRLWCSGAIFLRWHPPERRRAQRGLINIVLVPALVTKLESVGITARQHVQERRRALAVLGKLRRKLEQYVPTLGFRVSISSIEFAQFSLSRFDAFHANRKSGGVWSRLVAARLAGYLSFSAMLRCSLRCGSVVAAHFFSSESSPLFEKASKSATASRWALT